MPPYSVNDQPPPIPSYHGGDEPHVFPYNRPLTAQYSEVKRKDVTLHVKTHTNTTSGEDYSILKRDNIPHESLQNVTAGGDYSVINRDDVPYGTAAGDYSVLKREEREVS